MGEEKGEEKGKPKGLSLILYVKTEGAHKSDSEALESALVTLDKEGIGLDVILGDTSYGSNDNVEKAAALGVKLVSPVPGKGLKNKKAGASGDPGPGGSGSEAEEAGDASGKCLTLADFGKDEGGRITECPAGQKVLEQGETKGGGFRAYFACSDCKACPQKGSCPVKVGKFKASIAYTERSLTIADRRRQVETPEFKKLYKMRSGIEATNSLLKRRFGLHRLRCRGLKGSDITVKAKAIALNIARAFSFERKKMKK